MTAEADLLAQWERCVGEGPHRPALIIDGGPVLTYRELDRRTDALAADLVARGAGPERIVGLALASPASTVAGMVAVLKSGAAFTVLDGALPRSARAAIAAGANAEMWLADRADPAVFGEVPVLVPGRSGAGGRCDWRRHLHDGDQLAYVLFTSGSTGAPKGIAIERNSLSRFAPAVRDRLRLGPDDRWAQLASLGFDVLIEEVFPALTAGAAVVCRRDDRVPALDELHRMLEDTASTVVELSTQYWLEYGRWLAAHRRPPPRALHTALVGGERMDPDAYRAWQRAHDVRLVHVYGLTECTVTSTTYDGNLPAEASEVPVGVPLPEVEVSIRDAAGAAVAHGETGEIHLGGPLVGRGHVDGTTDARFGRDPRTGARTCATGDLGRIDADGQLVFAGRVDDQLKIRGHRVEPARIERLLTEHAPAEQAVVLADPRTGTALWAYLVLGDGSAPAAACAPALPEARSARLSARLAAVLPEALVPHRIHHVRELPKNAHGKVDRDALVSWTAVPAGSGGGTGSDALLATVLRCFRDVLDAPDLGPDDDFFVHGGHSVLALRLIAELRRELDPARELRPRVLFGHRTPRRLSAQLRTAPAPATPHR
ncbi:non-ribosomal peptide synthetase [Saccharopolyspora gregorii]|uniref:Carrier domain-containing protein n=1 Tax=Saccharopolyspora gregorii TaxID=33914 RepID=A0ABP6RS09_9PSEU